MPNAKPLNELSDGVLIRNLETLSSSENKTTVQILLHLAELDRRRLYLPLGFSSLFAYCTKSNLRYAETAAMKRITSARAVAKFPKLLELLITKELNLSTLSAVAGILTENNLAEVISACRGRSALEVKEYVSRFKPVTEIKERVRPVTVARVSSESLSFQPKGAKAQVPGLFDRASAKFSPLITAPKSGDCEVSAALASVPPVSAETRYELRFAVSHEGRASTFELNRAQPRQTLLPS